MNKYMSLESTIRSLGAKGASSPLEKDMNDQVHAGSYTSKHFEVSKPAQKLFASLPKDVDSDKAEKSLQLHDKLFAIHKKTKAATRSSKQDVDSAQELHDQIMSLAKEMDLEDKHGHVKDSLDFIKSNIDTESNVKDDINPEDAAKRFAAPPKDYQSDVKSDADIDNLAKFKISRDKRAQRKLKIIDDQYIPGVTEMDRIENVSPSFLEALKQVQANAQELEEKKKMTKADIAALREPKGSIDAGDLAALRAGEHKKKMKTEEKEESAAHEKAEKKHNNTPEGVECPVCGMKACPTVKEEAEDIDEGVRSIRKATRSMNDRKKAVDASRRLSKKAYTPPGTPSKAEMRAKGSEAVKAFLAKGGKIRKEEVDLEELDEAQFIVIQKGMEKKRIRNNPADIMQARKEGWAINEESDTVDEAATPLKSLGAQQAKATIQREVQQKKAMFAKKDAVDKQKFSKSMQKIHAGDEVEVDGEQIDEAAFKLTDAHKSAITKHLKNNLGKGKVTFHSEHGGHFATHSDGIQSTVHHAEMKNGKLTLSHFMTMDEEVDKKTAFMERAIAILGEEYAELSFEQLVEEVKKARGRPRKNPLPDPNAPKRPRGRPKKGSSPTATAKPGEAKPADTDKDREHIVMGLRKAVSLRGEHGVKFADGSTHKIPAEHAQKALKIHDSLSKPSEKMTFARKLAASHDSFKKALSDKNPGSEEAKKTGITLAKRAD